MKRIHFILLSTIVVLVAACSKQTHDLVHPDTPSSSSSYIFFEPEIVETVETRADGTSSFEGPSFGAIGYVEGVSIFTAYDNGIAEVVRDDNGLYVYSDLAQWKDATTDHNFYAFYPYDILENVSSGTDKVPYISYTQPTTLAAMKDVMTASTGQIKKRPLVEIQFSHRLWALDVSVVNSQTNDYVTTPTGTEVINAPNLYVTDAKIHIYGYRKTGNISMGGNTISGDDVKSDQSEKVMYDLFTASTDTPSLDIASTESHAFEPLLFMPVSATFSYRIEIKFMNSWGASYEYYYPAPTIDADSNPQYGYITLTDKNFEAGKRYSLQVEKIDATGEFIINWAVSPWDEISVDHTFN